MSQSKILIAEDDTNIRNGIVDTLESEGYLVTEAADGAQASALIKQNDYDLALLDIMMPKKDGYALCQEIRQSNKCIAIIMLTAKGQEIDKVLGLKLGADDYVTKPFGIQELLARVEAAIRRVKTTTDSNTKLPALLDFPEFQVLRKEYRMVGSSGASDLTAREQKLLEIFHTHPGEALGRDSLLNQAWGIDYLGTTRTLDQHIAQLRKKIATIGATDPLETVHGIGYRLRK